MENSMVGLPLGGDIENYVRECQVLLAAMREQSERLSRFDNDTLRTYANAILPLLDNQKQDGMMIVSQLVAASDVEALAGYYATLLEWVEFAAKFESLAIDHAMLKNGIGMPMGGDA